METIQHSPIFLIEFASTLYNSTRICLNLPFITSVEPSVSAPHLKKQIVHQPNHFAECAKICSDSADAIVALLQRFKSQHTLGNAPIIFVHWAIVATNSVLVTSRYSESSRPLVKNTHLPVLDAALQEMSTSWALAEIARTKFRHALGQKQQQHQRQSSLIQLTHDLDAQFHEQPATTDSSTSNTLGIDSTALGAVAQGIDFASPEQYVWDPMSILDGETEYWANMGDDSLAGTDLGFFGSSTGLDGAEIPWDNLTQCDTKSSL